MTGNLQVIKNERSLCIYDPVRYLSQPYRGRFIIVMADRIDIITVGTTTKFDTIITIRVTAGSETREIAALTMSPFM